MKLAGTRWPRAAPPASQAPARLQQVGQSGAGGLARAPQAAAHLAQQLRGHRAKVRLQRLLGLGHQRAPDVRHRVAHARVRVVLVPAGAWPLRMHRLGWARRGCEAGMRLGSAPAADTSCGPERARPQPQAKSMPSVI